MPNPAEVITAGVDSSGRAILMTRFMADWWEGVVAELGFRPVITQGAWMARVPGGGAENSKGYHDGGGCLDLRVWDLTTAQRLKVVRTGRDRGAGTWRRYKAQGMDEDHIHLVLGSDHGLTDAAAAQWDEYVAGGDGLKGGDRDYEYRPDPLVLKPPEDDMPAYSKWEQADKDALAADVAKAVLAAKPKDAERSLGQMVKELWNHRNG